VELIDETLDISGLTLRFRRPPNPGDLIDEERFADDEYMPYWAELWPAGIALARYLVAERDLRGKRVLELGCGLGLPSLAAAAGGAEVLATDWAGDALELLRANAESLGVELETLESDWRHADELVERGPWDLVLAADVLYEERNVEPLVTLLSRLATEALVGDPGRTYLEPFVTAVARHFELERWQPDPDGLPKLVILTLTR
jgi:predicted nicotinamide N-methyase